MACTRQETDPVTPAAPPDAEERMDRAERRDPMDPARAEPVGDPALVEQGLPVAIPPSADTARDEALARGPAIRSDAETRERAAEAPSAPIDDAPERRIDADPSALDSLPGTVLVPESGTGTDIARTTAPPDAPETEDVRAPLPSETPQPDSATPVPETRTDPTSTPDAAAPTAPTPAPTPERTPRPTPAPTIGPAPVERTPLPEYGEGRLYFHPDSQVVQVGERVTVQLMAEAREYALAHYTASVLFNPLQLEYRGIRPGLDPLLGSPAMHHNEVDGGQPLGILHILGTQTRDRERPLGTMISLAHIDFVALEPGQTMLEIGRMDMVSSMEFDMRYLPTGTAVIVVRPTPTPPPQ